VILREFVIAERDGVQPRVTLIRRLETGRRSHVSLIERQPLARVECLQAVGRDADHPSSRVVNERSIVGSDRRAHVDSTEQIGAHCNPVTTAWQQLTGQSRPVDRAALSLDPPA
jgi:hypothetical protein